MSDACTIEPLDDRDELALDVIGRGIHHYNRAQAGDNQHQPLCFVLRDGDGAIRGGVIGETSWGWLHLDLLWIDAPLRGLGYGAALLARAEDEARRRGIHHAYLDTFSFQAPDFYQRHGYEVFGRLEDFPREHARLWLKKEL